MKKIGLIVLAVALILVALHQVVSASTIPTISIQAVTKNEKVTIRTQNYPAGRTFEARMGLIGTKGIDGILVGTIDSEDGASLEFTFEIPTALLDEDQITIRLDSTTGGYYSYNWFTNSSFGSHTGGMTAEEPESVPSITIISVKQDTEVTISGVNFPSDETFTVLMGEEGTKGIDGAVVDEITASVEMDFFEAFEIPDDLKGKNKIDIRFESQASDQVISTTVNNETGSSGAAAQDDASYSGIPTISIETVEADQEVTIKTHNFPKNKIFDVLMGLIGTKGLNGIQVTSFDSEGGGSFEKTFIIPESLKGEYQIAIRLQTPDGHFYAYNWFYNQLENKPLTDLLSGYSGIPTFKIESVEADKTVTIKTHNFPPEIDFQVMMGKMGTKGINGINVTTINSGEGGVFTETFSIPSDLAGDYQIAVRLEGDVGGFYSFNWFYNNTTSTIASTNESTDTPEETQTPTEPSYGYTGIPTFTVTGVEEDTSVTIRTNNFPAGYIFEVLMGKLETLGIDGIYITSVDAGGGGEFTRTFEIPEALTGEYRIAIRLESTSGDFFAYRWFYNRNYP